MMFVIISPIKWMIVYPAIGVSYISVMHFKNSLLNNSMDNMGDKANIYRNKNNHNTNHNHSNTFCGDMGNNVLGNTFESPS